MTQKERMLAGLPYKAWMDGLPEESMENAVRVYKFNNCHPEDTVCAERLIRSILGSAGKILPSELRFIVIMVRI